MHRAAANSHKMSETHHASARSQGSVGAGMCKWSQNKSAIPRRRDPSAEDAPSVATALKRRLYERRFRFLFGGHRPPRQWEGIRFPPAVADRRYNGLVCAAASFGGHRPPLQGGAFLNCGTSLGGGFDCAVLADEEVTVAVSIADFDEPWHLWVFVGLSGLCGERSRKVVNNRAIGFGG